MVRLDSGSADGLRSLREWLVGEEELRGRVRSAERPPEAGRLGPVLDGLVIALAPGGVASVLAAAVVVWVRAQRGDVTVTVERSDGSSFRVEGRRLRGMDADATRGLVELASRVMDGEPSPDRDGG